MLSDEPLAKLYHGITFRFDKNSSIGALKRRLPYRLLVSSRLRKVQ